MQNVQNGNDLIERVKKKKMERNLGVTEAREKFKEVVDQVQHQGDAFIINRHGKPAAAVVPVEVYENWKRQRREFFDTIRKMQERADLEPEEADRIASEAVAAARGRLNKSP